MLKTVVVAPVPSPWGGDDRECEQPLPPERLGCDFEFTDNACHTNPPPEWTKFRAARLTTVERRSPRSRMGRVVE